MIFARKHFCDLIEESAQLGTMVIGVLQIQDMYEAERNKWQPGTQRQRSLYNTSIFFILSTDDAD